MTMFHEILDNPNHREPGLLQSEARRLFPTIVTKSHLEKRAPGDPVPSRGQYVIIGVATYSRDDLQLLDDVEAAHPKWGQTSRVVVFDLMDCKDMEDVRRYVPPFV